MPKRDATSTTVEGIFCAGSGNAILVEVDGVEHWLPLSQIKGLPEELRPRHRVTFTIPEWLAEDRDIYGIEDTD